MRSNKQKNQNELKKAKEANKKSKAETHRKSAAQAPSGKR